MEMGRRQIKLLIAKRELRRHSRDGRAIARPKARIDDQRRPAAHHNSDVGPTHDRPNMVRDLDCLFPQHRLILGGEPTDGQRPQEQ